MGGLHVLRKIEAVEAQPEHRLRITYEGGETIVADFAPLIRQGGVFAPLSDPAFFAQVAVDSRGRAVCWPGDIDFCADALWLQAHGIAEVA
jgi:hypothetical protein